MNKLKGSGNTFSTSGKPWLPFRFNPYRASRIARLHALKRKGLTPPADKAAQRALIEEACRTHPIRKVGGNA